MGTIAFSLRIGKFKALLRDAFGRDKSLKQWILVQCVLTELLFKIYHTERILRPRKNTSNKSLFPNPCIHVHGVFGSSVCLHQPYYAGTWTEFWALLMSYRNTVLSFIPFFWPNGIGVLRWLLIGSMIGPRHLPGRSSFSSPAHIWDSKDLETPTHLFSRMGLTEQHRQAETCRAFKRKLYDTWQTMSNAETKQREVRIVQLQPAIDWSLVWGTSPQRNNAWLSLRSVYMAIHDVIPTNVRLHWIRLMETDNCITAGGSTK